MMRPQRFSVVLFATAAAVAAFPRLAAPQAAPAQSLGSEERAVIEHLNAAITWYKQLSGASESAGQPTDIFYLDNARSLAKQALQLAFQSADAENALLLSEKTTTAAGGSPAGTAPASGTQQNVMRSAATTAAQISQIQSQIEALNAEIPKASGKKLQDLIYRRDSLQDQLEFNKTLQEALQKLSAFMTGNARKAGGLAKEIDDLKKLVPDIFPHGEVNETSSTPANPPPDPDTGMGLISQASRLFSKSADLRVIEQLIRGADLVGQDAREVQAPLRNRLRATIEQGRGLTNQPMPQDSAGIAASRQRAIDLTRRFKLISAATMPLAQETILLDDSQSNLRRWEESAHGGYRQALKDFLIHAVALLLGVIVVVVVSEVWRRATFRYVHEARMRHQLLLLRHLVTGLLLAIVLTLGFVSEFSSLATFAGFVAAGIAVALQTLLLSVAGYFFLIGRHGVMVGDRISVSGVTGDVIYVGLVRLYLTELAGTGSDLHPTGRVVVISNSVLFLGMPLLKQSPGTAYAWHEVVVNLEKGSDYNLAEKKLLDAVNQVCAQYRDTLEEQHQGLTGLIATSQVVPVPQARLQLVEKGLNLIVRYPVVLRRETEIDNLMAKQVVDLIHSDAELKSAMGEPTIRPAAKA